MVLSLKNSASKAFQKAVVTTAGRGLFTAVVTGLVTGIVGGVTLPANAVSVPKVLAEKNAARFSLYSGNKTAVEIGEDAITSSSSSAVFQSPASDRLTELTEPDGTTVILPPGYDASRSYPALVLMPYTDRTALHMFNWGIYDAYQHSGGNSSENAFVIIMPPGQGSSAN